jgi:PPE-repeat protein
MAAEAPAVLASAGQAGAVGGLSVPAGWSGATGEGATLAGTGWTAGVEEPAPMNAVPAGMPAMANAGRGGFGFGGPRYGTKPIVMPKPVGVG